MCPLFCPQLYQFCAKFCDSYSGLSEVIPKTANRAINPPTPAATGPAGPMKQRFLLLLCACVCTCVLPTTAQANNAALAALLADEWNYRLQQDPLQATGYGVHDYNDRLTDVSPAAFERHAAQDRQFLARLAAIDTNSLTINDQANAKLFRFELESRLANTKFKTWRIPFNSDSGFHSGLLFILEQSPFKTAQDYENYLARLAALPEYIDQQIANMRIGLQDGFTIAKEILPKVEPSFAALTSKTYADSAFYKPFTHLPDTIGIAQREALIGRGQSLVQDQVLPAFTKLHRFFRDADSKQARPTLGASALPDGKAFYAQQVRYFTTRDLSPEKVHELGRKEVARIRAEMDDIIERVGFDGSFKDFLQFLRTDPQFYVRTADDLLNRAARIAKRIDLQLPAYFATLPRMSYGVEPVPDAIAENYTTGRAVSPVPGLRGGIFWVNTYALNTRPLYNLPALALHEGMPGHVLQIALGQEQASGPDFRKHLYISAFGEGWGLYCERLGLEMGIYQDDYEKFGRLTYEMWRAGRLMVDTGMHAMGWSRAQAIDFFVENSALSLHNINTEVDRYISWPGQALSYKMGELTIIELRKHAEAKLGEKFDIRRFHDAVLAQGAVTLPMLEAQVERFIAQESQQGASQSSLD